MAAALSNTDALPGTTAEPPFITGVDTPTSIIPSVPVIQTTPIVEPSSILPTFVSIPTEGPTFVEPTYTAPYTQITPPPYTPITYTHTDIYTTYYTTYYIDICPEGIYCPGGTYNHYYYITEICTGDRATYTRPVIPPNYTTKIEPCPYCPGTPTLTVTCPIETKTVVPVVPVVTVKPPPVAPVVPVYPPAKPPVVVTEVAPAAPQQTVTVQSKPAAPIQVQANTGSHGMALERYTVALIGGILAGFVVLA